jgi:hypothetical protein
MEILIFALIASYNAHRQQRRVVAEPEEFQPFDLQALRNSRRLSPPANGTPVSGATNAPFQGTVPRQVLLRPLVLDR